MRKILKHPQIALGRGKKVVLKSQNLNPTPAPNQTRLCMITRKPTTHAGKDPGEVEVTEAGGQRPWARPKF